MIQSFLCWLGFHAVSTSNGKKYPLYTCSHCKRDYVPSECKTL